MAARAGAAVPGPIVRTALLLAAIVSFGMAFLDAVWFIQHRDEGFALLGLLEILVGSWCAILRSITRA